MSYFPDYRKETDKLNEVDKAGITGFRIAVESALSFFDNLDDDMLSIEKEIVERLKDRLKEWMTIEEIEFVCSLFDDEAYDDVELTDANEPKFKKADLC